MELSTIKWKLHKDTSYCFEQISKAVLSKTAVLQLLISHLAYIPKKARRHAGHWWHELRTIHKQRYSMDIWTHGLTFAGQPPKNLYSSVLCGHWVPSWGLTKCDGRRGLIASEQEGRRKGDSKESVKSACLDDDYDGNDDD